MAACARPPVGHSPLRATGPPKRVTSSHADPAPTTARSARSVVVELEGRERLDLGELDRLLRAYLETVYYRRPHRETGEPPGERFLAREGCPLD
jgi:hypothetical protein